MRGTGIFGFADFGMRGTRRENCRGTAGRTAGEGLQGMLRGGEGAAGLGVGRGGAGFFCVGREAENG